MSEGDVTGTDVQARAWPRGFGIVGSGVIASIHAEAIASLPAARLAAVTDVVPESATSLAGTFGCAAEPDLDALLARDDVDVVSVCVPSGLHADVGVRAAQAGKHLVVEKPIDVSLDAPHRRHRQPARYRDRAGLLVLHAPPASRRNGTANAPQAPAGRMVRGGRLRRPGAGPDGSAARLAGGVAPGAPAEEGPLA
jgi:Oxidoreductase family, NAD-binding Rossmann fold